MDFLFVYSYAGYRGFRRTPVNGTGSVDLSCKVQKITPDVIKEAKEWVVKYLENKGLTDVSVSPMGWFKYDE